MVYPVKLITIEDKERLAEQYKNQILYEVKSEIYGCVIKLLTGDRWVKEKWEENFYFSSQNLRSHGRLYVVEDEKEGKSQVYYDPQSKTAFLLNFDYYGWIKSLALSVAGDILEDEHDIYSVHGACLDVDGRGVCIVGSSGAGKTTHTYGLLRDKKVRVVSDDWFYARIFDEEVMAYSSEKNFYIRADLAKIWPEFTWLVEHAEFDSLGRAVVDLRWVIGKGRILPVTTLKMLIVLKRDPSDPEIVRRLSADEALSILEANGYFNPHLLVRNEFKRRLRNRFFRELLKMVEAYQVNTVKSPEETQSHIRSLLGLK
ncbi:aldolase [Candidatus Bathyarchaeota archaeon]|nr:MAG: aldolase [Candidatus Hecatellales archaeon]RLI35222.1 MAG: aldolase [Candidatus Bathyarchaeota archaeon]